MTTEKHPTMLDYVHESPEALECALTNHETLCGPLVARYVAESSDGTSTGNVVLVACGSSRNAAECAAPLMRRALGARVTVSTPGTCLVSETFPVRDTFHLVVTQSGCSTNALAVLDRLRGTGAPALALTANPEAEVHSHADAVFDFGCGEEQVGYVTKGVVTLAQYLMLFALDAAVATGRMGNGERDATRAQMRLVPEAHRALQASADKFYRTHRRDLLGMGPCYVLGFDQAWGVALEGALKLGETVKVPAFAYEAEEFNHGPNLQMTPAYTVFLVDDLARGHERMVALYRACRHVTDHAFLLTATAMDGAAGTDGNVFPLPEERPADPLLLPLYLLPFFQIIAYRATEEKGSWDELPLVAETEDLVPSKTNDILRFMPYL